MVKKIPMYLFRITIRWDNVCPAGDIFIFLSSLMFLRGRNRHKPCHNCTAISNRHSDQHFLRDSRRSTLRYRRWHFPLIGVELALFSTCIWSRKLLDRIWQWRRTKFLTHPPQYYRHDLSASMNRSTTTSNAHFTFCPSLWCVSLAMCSTTSTSSLETHLARETPQRRTLRVAPGWSF